MIKIVLITSLFFISIINAFEIEAINPDIEDNTKNFYMKDGKKVIKPISLNIIKAIEPKIIKAMDIKVVKTFEIDGKSVVVKKIADTNQIVQQQKVNQEDIKKQFATQEQLQVKSKDEKLKVSKESADFFESINKEDNAPVNME